LIFLKNPALKFVLLFIPSVVLWFTFYTYAYKIDMLFGFNFDSLTLISKILSQQSNFILNAIGFNATTEVEGKIVISKVLNYNYNHGVWIGEPCNGVKIFGLFSIFIMCFKGNIKSKFWFIPIGIITIHFLNVFRIATLAVIAAINPFLLNFNHNVTFQIIIYGTMLLLWFFWIKKFSKIKTRE
tara:strand:- start:17 stop:568 length:552 start_codon:yes stop_codon:yes gene_type:complete